MRQKLILFLSSILLIFACKSHDNKPEQTQQDEVDDVSLVELKVDYESVLEKLDNFLVCSLGEVEKYSVELQVKSKNENAIITVGTDHIQADGSAPFFTVYLSDGENIVKIVSTSPKDTKNRKVYTLKITKKDKGIPDSSSSKLSELKVDNIDVLPKMSHNVCTLDNAGKDKNNVEVKVTAHNPEARIKVINKGTRPSEIAENTYDVPLLHGLNIIKVIVKTRKEGDRCYAIKIYKEEDLSLATFKVEDGEYYDSNEDKLKPSSITFPEGKTSVVVKAKAKSSTAILKLKVNGSEINADGGAYTVNLIFGRNNAEITVVGGDEKHSKSYKIIFYRISPNSDTDMLITLKAEDVDLLPLLSADKSVTLKAVQNEKTSLKLEAKSSSATVKVKNGSVDVQESGGFFMTPLNEGSNRISVMLYNGNALSTTYLVFIRRNPKPEDVPNPANDEVTVSIFVSDGVNGSPVDGTKLKIFKTKEVVTTPLKTLTIINGKAKINLKKGEFYDFRLEGLNDETASTRYAASDVISQYIDENKTVVPMVQHPLLMITRPAQAPEMRDFEFGSDKVLAGSEITADSMKQVSISLLASSFIEDTDFGTPSPILAVGFVPVNGDTRYNAVVRGRIRGSQQKVTNGRYESSWVFDSHANFIKGETIDIVVVAYDKAANRLEYHTRVKVAEETEENSTISVEDFKLQFKRLPTPSSMFSVGEDEGTGSSTHYKANFSCAVKEGNTHARCIGFDLYRKCLTDNETDFKLAKRFIYNGVKISSDTDRHLITDSDGVLEDEKTYEYRIVAYTKDGKKSSFSSSPVLSLTVPKSNTILLEYPVDVSISKADLEQSGYKFRFTNPKILQVAKEMKLGFIITNRFGRHYWGSKFKYVFEDAGGKPELYFAKVGDDLHNSYGYYIGTNYSLSRGTVTAKSVNELISIDKDRGEVRIHNAFFMISPFVNLARSGSVPGYDAGDAYYWDIVDFGSDIDGDKDDMPGEIISKEVNGVTIIFPASDFNTGNNAWNGRAEFTIKTN